jgi:hypothetical protein
MDRHGVGKEGSIGLRMKGQLDQVEAAEQLEGRLV